MIARYEQSVLSGSSRVTVQRYGGLQNLPHWHMESEFVFAEKGRAEVMVENTVYDLPEGGCIFIRCGAVHYIKAGAESVVSVMKIDSELISSAVGGQTLVCPLIKSKYPFDKIFDKLRREISAGEKYYETVCSGLAAAMTAEIFRNEITSASVDSSESAEYKQLLRLISERYADMTFNEAAEFMCFSKPYFSKYFRRMSGMTFTEYMNIVRVGAAVKMLSARNMSVGEIALASGFGTIRSFNRVFKTLTGYAPRDLPKDHVFIVGDPETDGEGFDPTLSGTIIL